MLYDLFGTMFEGAMPQDGYIGHYRGSPVMTMPFPKRIICNPPATIVFWKDGTKTVVKAMEGQEYSPYFGYLAALSKRIYGSNSFVQSMLKKAGAYKEEEK